MKKLLFFIALALCLNLSAYGQEKIEDEKELKKGVKELRRGIMGIAFSWAEVPKNTYKISRDRTLLYGLTYGIFKGAGMTVRKTGESTYKTGLFFLPPLNKEREEFKKTYKF